MTRYLLALVVAVALTVAALAIPVSAGEGETCFFDRDSDSGMNKICYYRCLSGTVAITVKSTQLCPLNIKR